MKKTLRRQGMNKTFLRKQGKRNLILSVIRGGGEISRFEVKKKTHYSMSTTLAFVSELVDERLIYEEECAESRVGRRPVWLRINPDGAYFIGVDFNSRNIYLSVLDFSYREILRREEECGGCPAGVLTETMVQLIKEAVRDLGEKKERIRSIGIGVPGQVDKDKGLGVYYPHIEGFRNVPLVKRLSEEFPWPVRLENNINAMSVWVKNLHRNTENFLFISIRSGIRMSIYLGDKLYLGENGTAGEIGHVRVPGGTRPCSCGKRGCLDTEASNLALINKIQEGDRLGRFQHIEGLTREDGSIDLDAFYESAAAGDPESGELVKEAAANLAESLVRAIITLNPGTVVVSGDIVKAGEVFTKTLEDAVAREASYAGKNGLRVHYLEREPTMGSKGAAMMAALEEFGTEEYNL